MSPDRKGKSTKTVNPVQPPRRAVNGEPLGPLTGSGHGLVYKEKPWPRSGNERNASPPYDERGFVTLTHLLTDAVQASKNGHTRQGNLKPPTKGKQKGLREASRLKNIQGTRFPV